MQSKMLFQSPLFRKSAIAMSALERSLALVSSHVTLPRVFMKKSFSAKFALPRSFAGVTFNMKLEL